MRVGVYAKEEHTSMRVANDICHYFFSTHPEYYARILNFCDFPAFDASAEHYSLDLYLLQVDCCDASDTGYRIASLLRKRGTPCVIAFIVPAEGMVLQLMRAMLQPSYVFLREAATKEIHTFLGGFLLHIRGQSFMAFLFQYKKWLLNIDKITHVITNGARTLLVCVDLTLESTERLAELERRLPAHFVRVDKGCLLNTRQLMAIDFAQQKAILQGGCFVYMSRRGTKKLFELMNAGNELGEELA